MAPLAPAATPPPLGDEELRRILQDAKVIAIVGLSEDPTKDSHQIGLYLKEEGYRVVAVNPKVTSLLGEKAWGSVEAIPVPIDIVDVFRKPETVGPIADAAVHRHVKCLWMQVGIVNELAAAKARTAGIPVVMDRCIRDEHRRLFGT